MLHSAEIRHQIGDASPASGEPSSDGTSTFSRLNPRVGLNYNLSPAAGFYAVYAQGFRRLLGERASDGDRAHGAGEREGGDDDPLAILGHGHQSGEEFVVDPARRVHVDDAQQAGLRQKIGAGEAARQGGHVDGIFDPLSADAPRVPAAIGKRDLRPIEIEMAGFDRKIDGFHRRRAGMVQHVQALMQADEIALRLEGAGPASAIEIRDIGRTPHGREIDPRAAHGQGPLGVAGMKGECLRRLGDQLADQAAIEAHHACRPVDHGAVTPVIVTAAFQCPLITRPWTASSRIRRATSSMSASSPSSRSASGAIGLRNFCHGACPPPPDTARRSSRLCCLSLFSIRGIPAARAQGHARHRPRTYWAKAAANSFSHRRPRPAPTAGRPAPRASS